MSLYLRGKIYHVRAMVGGEVIARSTKTSNRRLAEQLERKRVSELHSEIVVAGRRPVTYEKAIAGFLDARQGQPGVESARQKLALFKQFYGHNLHEVTAQQLQAVALAAVEKGYSVNTVNVSIIYLNALQNFASKNNYTPGPKLQKLKGGFNRVRFLTDEEVQRLLTALHPDNASRHCKEEAQDNLDFVEMLLLTGARDREIGRMRLDQIDLAAGTITIHRSKGGSDTTMKLTRRMLEIINRRIASGASDGFLFPHRAKGPRGYGWLHAAGKRANIEDINLHLFRHTFACKMLRSGANLLMIQRLLGHRDYQSTLCYAHLAPDEAANFALSVLDA